MKRANGEGCIRKLKGNRKKPYQAIVTTYNKETKKQTFVSLGTYETYEQAERIITEYNIRNKKTLQELQESNINTQEHIRNLYDYLAMINTKLNKLCNINDNNKITIQDLYTCWKKEHFKNVSKNTKKYYYTAFKNMQTLHNKYINDLKLNDLQIYCNTLTTSKQIAFRILINQLYKYAIANDYVTKNYSNYLVIKKDTEKRTKNIFTHEEIESILNLKTFDIYDRITIILLFTGMRISELFNLQKNDCNFKDKIITINAGKTESARRKIPIHDKIIKHIEYFYNTSNTNILVTFNSNSINYATCNNNIKNKFNHTLHETRHTFATQCKECKLDPYVTKLILGHSTTDLTLNTYTHLNISTIQEEFKKFNY